MLLKIHKTKQATGGGRRGLSKDSDDLTNNKKREKKKWLLTNKKENNEPNDVMGLACVCAVFMIFFFTDTREIRSRKRDYL